MKRWHLTLGLAGAAVVAAAFAPRLFAALQAPSPAVPDAPPPVAEVPVPPVVPVVPVVEAPQGRLVVDAGLDRTAVLEGSGSERFLTITVRAPAGEGESVRQPVNLGVVIDTSGSMSAQGKIEHARAAAKALARSMQAGDDYALIAFNDDARVIVPSGPMVDTERVLRQIDRIYEGGGTNLYAGIELGKRQVRGALGEGEVGRIVILSDGNANVGVTDPDSLTRFAADAAASGVTVSALGLGLEYNEDLLARIADVGGGTYDYVDDPSELATVFASELNQAATVVARSTALTVELPPNVEPIEVLGWDAERSGNGWTVFLGDVNAGAERKVVARVRVTGHQPGEIEVAEARADYVDVLDGAPASSHDVATAEVTSDPNRVAGSLDREKAAAASSAWGNRYLEMSTRAYAAGDLKKAKDMLAEGTEVLKQGAAQTGSDKLSFEANQLELQLDVYSDNAPTSAAGQRAIKMNKEFVRDASR